MLLHRGVHRVAFTHKNFYTQTRLVFTHNLYNFSIAHHTPFRTLVILHQQFHSLFTVFSSWFITCNLHIFFSTLFWSTPSCSSFGPHCRLVRTAQIVVYCIKHGIYVKFTHQALNMLQPAPKPSQNAAPRWHERHIQHSCLGEPKCLRHLAPASAVLSGHWPSLSHQGFSWPGFRIDWDWLGTCLRVSWPCMQAMQATLVRMQPLPTSGGRSSSLSTWRLPFWKHDGNMNDAWWCMVPVFIFALLVGPRTTACEALRKEQTPQGTSVITASVDLSWMHDKSAVFSPTLLWKKLHMANHQGGSSKRLCVCVLTPHSPNSLLALGLPAMTVTSHS